MKEVSSSVVKKRQQHQHSFMFVTFNKILKHSFSKSKPTCRHSAFITPVVTLCGCPWTLTFQRMRELKESFCYIGWKLHVNSRSDRGLHLLHTSVCPALQSTGLFPAAGLQSRIELWWKDSSKHSTNTFLIIFAVHPISSFLIGIPWPYLFSLTYFFDSTCSERR